MQVVYSVPWFQKFLCRRIINYVINTSENKADDTRTRARTSGNQSNKIAVVLHDFKKSRDAD
jgi:hypothetical protein